MEAADALVKHQLVFDKLQTLLIGIIHNKKSNQ